jgi:anti-sigma factor RsiW
MRKRLNRREGCRVLRPDPRIWGNHHVTCREFADFMADYLSGELSHDIRVRFDEHLSVCPNCVTYLANYEKATALGRQAFQESDSTLAAGVPDELVKAILAARRS